MKALRRDPAPEAGLRLAEPEVAHRSQGWMVALAVCAAITAALLVRTGPTISTDETTYLGVGHSLASGDGFSQPFGSEGARLERLGPALPLVLGVLELAGFDPLTAATILNVLLFAASVLLAAALAFRLTNGNRTAAIAAGVLLMTSRAMLQMHGRILSEPLYVFLELAFLHLLLSAHRSGRRSFTLAAGLTAAAALGTRYVGLALLGSGLVAIAWLGRERPGRRLGEALTFAAPSVVGAAAWVALSVIRGSSATARSFRGGSLGSSHLRDTASSVTEWMLTFRVPGGARLVVAAALAAAGAWLMFRRSGGHQLSATRIDRRGMYILGLVAAIHLGVLLATILFLDPNVRLESRLLLPVEVAATPLLAIGAVWLGARANALRTAGSRRPAAAVVAIAAIFALHIGSAAALVEDGMGGGYQAGAWRTSPTVTAIRALPAGVKIYANAPEAIWFLADRNALWIPEEHDQYSGAVNRTFSDEVVALGDELRAGRAVVVFLREKTYWHMPTEAELRSFLGAQSESVYADGVVIGRAAGS